MQPLLAPSADNHCILAASIHLPQSQQSRFCLGGRYRACSRFQRQQDRPLPRYVTGVSAPPPPPPPPPPELPTLPWRRAWGRQFLRLVLLALAFTLILLAWQWRQSTLPPLDLTRPPLSQTPPPSLPPPSETVLSPFHRPPIGPPLR